MTVRWAFGTLLPMRSTAIALLLTFTLWACPALALRQVGLEESKEGSGYPPHCPHAGGFATTWI